MKIHSQQPPAGLDFVGAPNLVVVAPAIFAKKKSEQTDRQTSDESYL